MGKAKAKKTTEDFKEREIPLFPDGGDPDQPVTRQELVGIIKQIGDNVNEVSEYLSEDVNAMYRNHVFSFQMITQALRAILVKKGVTTDEEIEREIKEYQQRLVEKAKEVRESDDSHSVEIVPDDEAKIHENRAVLKAQSSNGKKG